MADGETVRTAFDAFMSEDLDAVGGLLEPDVTWFHWEAGPWDCYGRDAVLERMRERIAEGFSGELEEVIEGEGRVYARISNDRGGSCMAIRMRSGRIAAIQDHASPQEARIDAGLEQHVPPEPPGPGNEDVHDLVAFVHVSDVSASAAFYEHFGFRVTSTYQPGQVLNWCFLRTDGGASLMLARAEAPIRREEQAVLLYLYSRDLAGLRKRLLAAGLRPSPIFDGSPGPRHELRVTDPDGYTLMVAQLES